MENILDLRDIPQKGYAFLYFYASWIPYGKRFDVLLNKYEMKYSHINFFSVDVDKLPEFVSKYKITVVPSFILLEDTKSLGKLNGCCLASTIKALILKAKNEK